MKQCDEHKASQTCTELQLGTEKLLPGGHFEILLHGQGNGTKTTKPKLSNADGFMSLQTISEAK